MSGKTYGYVRVSTRAQKEDRQLIAMRVPVRSRSSRVSSRGMSSTTTDTRFSLVRHPHCSKISV